MYFLLLSTLFVFPLDICCSLVILLCMEEMHRESRGCTVWMLRTRETVHIEKAKWIHWRRKWTKGTSMLISALLKKKPKAEGLHLSTQTFRFQLFVLYGWWWMCAALCVCVCWSLWSCVRKHFPTNAAHNTYACSITTPIRPSLSPSLPNPKSFISLSLVDKAPIHCPANQSLHSCSQLSMTRFIWPGPCPSHQPSSFFH